MARVCRGSSVPEPSRRLPRSSTITGFRWQRRFAGIDQRQGATSATARSAGPSLCSLTHSMTLRASLQPWRCDKRHPGASLPPCGQACVGRSPGNDAPSVTAAAMGGERPGLVDRVVRPRLRVAQRVSVAAAAMGEERPGLVDQVVRECASLGGPASRPPPSSKTLRARLSGGAPAAARPSADQRQKRPWCAGGAARIPIDFGRCARSNHGPASIEVTVAPPRSAMSPAAATSQADSPPCCTKASKRPFAT